MRIAVLFSGQGNQQPDHFMRLRQGAGPDLAAALQKALPTLWDADPPPSEALSPNRIAQPLIFGLQLQLWVALAPRLPRPICFAGYSLGEMAACCAAGLFTPATGIALCSARARLMDVAVSEPAGMLAISGLARMQIQELTAGTTAQIAICNGADQFVIGGLIADLDSLAEAAESVGALRVARLAVTTPSHTALLASATAQFPDLVAASCANRLTERVLSAIDGRRLSTAEQAITALARQLSMPLDWATCMDAVAEHQPDRVLEVGPGAALARLWAGRFPAIPVRAVDEFRSLDGVVEWVTGGQR